VRQYFISALTLLISQIFLRHRTFSLIISLILNNIVSFLRNDAFTMTYFNSNFFSNTVTVARNSEDLVFVLLKIG